MPSASSIRHKPSSWDCASIGNVKQRHRKDTYYPLRHYFARTNCMELRNYLKAFEAYVSDAAACPLHPSCTRLLLLSSPTTLA